MQPWLRTVLCQLRSSSAVMLMTFVQGMALGWPSPALEKLANSEEAPFSVTTSERSWIVSIADLGIMVGAWASALVFSRAGRRQTTLVCPVAHLTWVLLTFFAASPAYLMVARLLCGAAQGIVISFGYMYIGEVAPARIRGSLILSTVLLIPVGQLVAYSYSPFVSFQWQAIMPLPAVLLTFVLLFLWMEETPFYLAMAGRNDEMLEVLLRLRRGVPDEEVRAEATAIRETVERQLKEAGTTWRQAFEPQEIRRGCYLVLVISGSLAVVGSGAVLSYTMQIFRASGTPMDRSLASILIMAVKVVMVILGMFVIEYFGRRLQLTLTSFGNAIAMGGMCAFMVVKDVLLVDTSSYSWVPLVLMILFIACCGLGVNTVPQVLMSELLSPRVKVILAPVIMTIVSVTLFLTDLYFLPLGENPGYYVSFAFFAAFNLFIAVFTMVLVPETKGKTLAEVQDMLRSRKFRSQSKSKTRVDFDNL